MHPELPGDFVNLSTTTQDTLSLHADLLALGVGADLAGLDRVEVRGIDLRAWAKRNRFSGSAGSALVIPGVPGVAAEALALIGTGKGRAIELVKAAAKVGRTARSLGAQSVVVDLPGASAEVVSTHVLSGNYVYDKFKPEKSRKPALKNLTIRGEASIASDVATFARWQSMGRDLINAPASHVYPESLADWAREHLGAIPGVHVEVWDPARLEAEGCVGLLAVGRGSARPPHMIRASYRPDGAKAHLALVGKGITFDAGGLSIKPSSGMQTMRCDMGGAATVLAAFGAIAEAGVKVHLDVLVAAAENMVDGNSYKLGDILTYPNGVTVEIHNTDAEGRLVLADALLHASRIEGVTHLVDAATLTGACVVALGSDFTALFTDSEDLATELHTAAERAGEGLWRLPLHQDYVAKLKGEWGQLKNVGGREAGSTTAALFLQHFVDGPTWAHLDIAGSSFHDKACGRCAAGATGQPIATLVEWIRAKA
ncbi:MAG: leucyl aminopeptidase [Deltaproteobacteria bacterium]|nr:MAG: leucyl aminopeptidase [Deltaproteobacteria bacterium]